MNHTFPESKIYVDGAWQSPQTKETFQSINPATGKPVAAFTQGSTEDVNRAVESARRALQGPWRSLDPSERGRMMNRVAQMMRERKEILALLDTSDMGKGINDARGDVDAAALNIEFYAGLATHEGIDHVSFTGSSGVGQESGVSGAIESYTRVKNVAINLDTNPSPWPDPRG